MENYIVRNWEGKVYAVTTSLRAAQAVVRLCEICLVDGETLLIIDSDEGLTRGVDIRSMEE
jgi:hypothetical protein